jgi:hypothetical protein
MRDDEQWWDSNLSRDLEDSLAAGGTTPREFDRPIGELLRKVSQIESILAGTTMAYFQPARNDRAAELEALLSYHLPLEVLIDLLPRLVNALDRDRRDWVTRHGAHLAKELHELRKFRNSLAHGTLWWDFGGGEPGAAPPLKIQSYRRNMRLVSELVTEDLLRDWIGRAYEACAILGQIHYWITEAGNESSSDAL